MAKVVLVDNLSRQIVPDKLLVANITEVEALLLASQYNSIHTEINGYRAEVKENDYKLFEGEMQAMLL